MGTNLTKSFWQSFRFWCTSYYCRQYKDKFAHARKLFVIDLVLIISGCVLLFFVFSWFLLQPKSSVIDVSFSTAPERIVSGEELITYVVLRNTTDQTLRDVSVLLSPPSTYQVTKLRLENQTYPTSSFRHLVYGEPIPAGESIELTIAGRLYAPIASHTPVSVTTQYRTPDSSTAHVSFGRFLLATHESVLKTAIDTPEQLIAGASDVITVTVQNDGDTTLDTVSLHLAASVDASQPIPEPFSIAAGQVLEKTIPLTIPATTQKTAIDFILTPILLVAGVPVENERIAFSAPVIRPEITLTSEWEKDTARIGDQRILHMRVRNTGKQPVSQPIISVSEAVVDKTGLTPLHSRLQQGVYVIEHDEALNTLAPNEAKTLAIPFAISPSKHESTVRVPITVGTTINEKQISLQHNIAPLRIASNLLMTADARFYTNDGDQIGRGSLPLRVGEETRLWATIKIANGLNTIEEPRLLIDLPAGVLWTGNASLSRGRQPTQTADRVSWHAERLDPLETASINIELSLTPTTATVGTWPQLIDGVRLQGSDSLTNLDLSMETSGLSLKETRDTRLRNSGPVKR